MFTFKRKFSVEITLKSGAILKFPKGFFQDITCTANNGLLSEITYKIRNGNFLYLKLDEVVSIVSVY